MKEWGEHKQCGSRAPAPVKAISSTPIPAHPPAVSPAPSSSSRVSFSSSPSPVRPGHSHLSGKMPVQTSTPGRPRATDGPSGGWVAQEHHELAVCSVLPGDGVTPTGWKLHGLHTPGVTCSQPHSRLCVLASSAPAGWSTTQPVCRQRLPDSLSALKSIPFAYT